MEPARMNAISSPSVTADCPLLGRLLEGLTIDTRPFPDLHATDQCQGSASSLSILLSTASRVGGVERTSVFGNSQFARARLEQRPCRLREAYPQRQTDCSRWCQVRRGMPTENAHQRASALDPLLILMGNQGRKS